MAQPDVAYLEVIVRDRQSGTFHAAWIVVPGEEPYIGARCAVLEYDVVPWAVIELAEPESLHSCIAATPEPVGEEDE